MEAPMARATEDAPALARRGREVQRLQDKEEPQAPAAESVLGPAPVV
jgi:hypothetical protein